MATYNIEMNALNSSGSYDVLYPQTTYSNILDVSSNNGLIWETGKYTGTGENSNIIITYSTQNAMPLFISILSKSFISQDFGKISEICCYTGTIPLADYDSGYDAYYGTSIPTMDAENNFSNFPVMFRVALKDNNSFRINQIVEASGNIVNIINAANIVYEYCLLLKTNT